MTAFEEKTRPAKVTGMCDHDWEWPEEVLESARKEAREWAEQRMREREAERKKLRSRLSRAWNNGRKIFSLLFQRHQKSQ